MAKKKWMFNKNVVEAQEEYETTLRGKPRRKKQTSKPVQEDFIDKAARQKLDDSRSKTPTFPKDFMPDHRSIPSPNGRNGNIGRDNKELYHSAKTQQSGSTDVIAGNTSDTYEYRLEHRSGSTSAPQEHSGKRMPTREGNTSNRYSVEQTESRNSGGRPAAYNKNIWDEQAEYIHHMRQVTSDETYYKDNDPIRQKEPEGKRFGFRNQNAEKNGFRDTTTTYMRAEQASAAPFSMYHKGPMGDPATALEAVGEENHVFTNGKLDYKKFRTHGLLPFRVAGIEKLSIKATSRFLIDSSTYGTDARRGYDEAADLAALTAGTAVNNARITLAHSIENNMSLKLGAYNKILIDTGGNSMLSRFGVDRITGLQDIDSVRKGINVVLRQNYGVVIRGSGKTGLVNAMRFLAANKGNLSPELEDLIKTIYRDAQHADNLLGHRRRFSSIIRVANRRIGRYIRQTDGGYGMYLIYQIAARSRITLAAGIRLVRSIGKSAMIASLQVAKATAWAAAKAAKHLPESVTKRTAYKTAEKAVRKTHTAVDTMAKQAGSFIDKVHTFRKDPFRIHSRMRGFSDRARTKVLNRLNKTILRKPIKVAGRVLRIPNMIASTVGRAISAVTAVVHGITTLLLWVLALGAALLLLITIIGTIVSLIAGLFDFTVHDEEIIDAAIEQLEESYNEQNEAIEALYSQYRNVNVNYVDVKDEEVYNENLPSYPVNQTTNAAEILSMATVYFDFDLESAGKQEVKDYVRKLYNGSHQTSIVTHVYTYTDENGEPYTVKDADVTVKTYYFNDIFNCSLQDTFGTLSGTETSEQIWNYFRSVGFSEESTAAIMGNIMQESGMDPTAVQNGGAGPAAGLVQWENYTAGTGRWKGMSDYAESQGKSWTDLKCQLDYILIEMPTVFQTYTGHGTYTYENGTVTWWPVSVSVDEFKAMTDISEATEIFERTFTRASIPRMENRISYAQSYYDMYKGTEASSDTAQTIIDTAYEQLGKPYQYGATGPDSFDCSGLVQYCYQAAGISIPRTAEEQAAEGTLVYTPEPGDICCTTGHVGIYIGNNQMIEAQGDGVPVCISQVRADKFVRFE